MTVRTTQLAAGLITSAVTNDAVYTVPSGFRAIVKDIRLDNEGSGGVSVAVKALVASVNVGLLAVSPLASGAYASLACEVTLNAGDALTVTQSGIVTYNLRYVFSGAQLELP